MSNGLVLALAYSDGAYTPLPSALEGLTAEFGMGSGVTPPLVAPGQKHHDDAVQRPQVIRNIDRHYWGRTYQFNSVHVMGRSCLLVSHEQYTTIKYQRMSCDIRKMHQ